jgi:hypothetical protein
LSASGDAAETGAKLMDFIERIFGFSPDDGSGSFELLLFALPVAAFLFVRAWRRHFRRR